MGFDESIQELEGFAARSQRDRVKRLLAKHLAVFEGQKEAAAQELEEARVKEQKQKAAAPSVKSPPAAAAAAPEGTFGAEKEELNGFLSRSKSGRVKGLLEKHLATFEDKEEEQESLSRKASVRSVKSAASTGAAEATISPKQSFKKHADPEPAAEPMEASLRSQQSWTKQLTLKIDGTGQGMMDDMQEVLDDAKVQFSLVKIPVGSGTFARNKMIYMEWVGENVPAMKRAKQVQKGQELKSLFGHTHASYSMSTKEQCTLDECAKELKSVFVTDSGTFSTSQIKAELEKRIAAAAGSPRRGRRTAKDMNIQEDVVLKEMRKNLGRFNWVLLEPGADPLKLFNAGSKSIDEMHDNLDETKVLFGLIRLGFGSGAYRRNKWVCVTFIGSQVRPMQRGRDLAQRGPMETVLKPFTTGIEVHGKEDATVSSILDRVRPFVVSDDFDKSGVTEEAYREALAEEMKENADFWGDDEEPDFDNDHVAVINSIKDGGDDGLSWGVFSYA
eukprot:TRINITY_DN3436_c0_g3_i1.p1 TRINITY_DN3436_c0_g3~~TRINITY_DN3436_c0_g3_i1.p1  ORF type:complete len:517 (+),score=249.87 TRINITY_DN3436_c0_g3_i1:46-1551(+)